MALSLFSYILKRANIFRLIEFLTNIFTSQKMLPFDLPPIDPVEFFIDLPPIDSVEFFIELPPVQKKIYT